MGRNEINGLDNILSQLLPTNQKVQNHRVQRLTAAGENYGSLMLKVSVDIEAEDKNQVLEVVAKLPPPTEFLKEVFNTKVTFRNEVEFYKTFVPILQEYQKNHGIVNVLDCFPKFYGARLSLNPDEDQVDDDAVLILENIKILNYDCASRFEQFGLHEAKVILKNLAEFQSVPMAIKMDDPELFESKFLPLLPEFKLFSDESTMKVMMKNQLLEIVEGDETIRQHLKLVDDLFEKCCKNNFDKIKNSSKFRDGLYRSITHCDLWVNNIMLKYKNDEVIGCKFVDFQIYEFGPVVLDVMFFIFSSVKISVIQQNFDELLKIYHDTLIENLEKLGCDVSEFSFEKFEEEIKYFMIESEFFHIAFMLNPIFAPEGSVKEVEELSEEELNQKREIPKQHREKAVFIINFLLKKGWLK